MFLQTRIACLRGQLDLVRYLVEEVNASVDLVDKNGENCLFYAVMSNCVDESDQIELVEYLLELGVQVNRYNKTVGLTELLLKSNKNKYKQ